MGEMMRMKFNLKLSRADLMKLWSAPTVLAGAALACLLLIGSGLTSHAAAQTPAATTQAKTAGETFKNVKTTSLKALTVDDFMAAMGVISADLGLDCADCHPGAGSDKVNWVIDTPQKITARKMIDMVAAINKTNFNGIQNVTCWTCHHGRERPATSITLDKLYGAPNDEKDDFVPQGPGEPTGAQVLDKYVAALGSAQKLSGVTSFIASGKSLGYEGLGGGGAFQIYGKAPDMRTTQITFKDHPERGDSTRTYNGKTGWVKQPRAAVPEFEYQGSELDGVRMDALLGFPAQLKTALTAMRTNTADIGDKDVQVLQGSGPHGILVTLYFDKKTSLLARMVRYSKSPVGRVPTQIDYADYRDVGGVKFPFQYTFSWLDGKDVFKLDSVKTNVPIDAAVFGKPK
jgi:photosynthetic reaction center cytochrome c subunit